MKRLAYKQLLALVCVGWLALPASAAPAIKPPVEAFFQDAEMSRAILSPNGRHVLVRVAHAGARRALVLVDLASMAPTVLASYSNGDIGFIYWLNDKRVAYTVVNIDPSVESTTSGLYAIDLDGKEKLGLDSAIVSQRSFAAKEELLGPGEGQELFAGKWMGGSDNMPVHIGADDDDGATVASINTRTGKQTALRSPIGSTSWLFDDTGQLRVATTHYQNLYTLQLLDAKQDWRKLYTYKSSSAATVIARAYVGNTLYVQARNGGDRFSLFRFNVERGALEQPALITSPDLDIQATAINEGKRLLGFRVITDAESTVWFDPAMKALQAEIDALLPATVNRIERGANSETPFVLVNAYSPVHPGDTLVYNRDTRKLTRLGTALPGIVPKQMASPLPMARYKARDGMSIPVQVTLPKGEQQKNLPTVVLVADTPFDRNTAWAFDPEVQFLVSRGYAVIQPQTRGRKGFGAAHFNASFVAGKWQLSLGIQDDLADGAKWAIAQGIADPKRICIAGTSIGGYSAMLGLIKDPELFRCGISWAGIVDAQSGSVSLLENARRITHPVLLAYGAKDAVPKAEDGRRLYQAIKPGNPDAEFIMFDEKGQSPSLEKNRAELWTRIEQFLDHHIGAGSHL